MNITLGTKVKIDMRHQVYLAKIEEDLREKMLAGLEWIGWEEIVKPDSTVFVKPNIMWREYLPGVNTTPEFLNTLLSILKDRCDQLIVGESSAATYSADLAFKNQGVYEICRDNGAELYNLSRMPSTWIVTEVDGKQIKVEVSKQALDADVFITVPVLKTHMFTKTSISLKNQYGCIPDSMRQLYHPKLDHVIAALNKAIKPQIAVVDGIYALDGGPHDAPWARPVKLDTLIISNDLVAADSVGSFLMGFSAHEIKHIMLAEAEGLGTSSLQQIEKNEDLPIPQQFRVKLNWLHHAAGIASCKNYWLAKIVFDSPLTPVIYRVLRREKPRRIR